jgi:putative NADH-flavin reductase
MCMKIGVIGAAGRTGRFVMMEGARRGHEMTAFARNPAKLAGVEGVSRIIKGNAQSEADLTTFSMGQEAVIVILNPPSPFKPTTIQADAARYLTRAAEAGGAKRIVWTSSTGLSATRPQPLAAIVKPLLRHLYADLKEAEEILEASSLDWTLARSVGLTNKRGTGRIRLSFGAFQTPSGPYFFSRADLALALVELVTDARAHRALVSINPPRRQKRALATEAARGTSSR